MLKINALKEKAKYIRNEILDICAEAGTGHVNSSFSCVEILTALYYGDVLRFDSKKPKWQERDRFILSKGHASILLYIILADLGFFSKKEFNHFGKADGLFGVHLQYNIPGVEITTGSLGHGFGVAAGMALAAKMNRELYMTIALLGDGECYEGSIWETAMFASHNCLNNLIVIVDRNHLCVTDFTEDVVALEPMDQKWKSFGWRVININGHSFEEILKALSGFRSRKYNKPLVIIADTTKGEGVSCLSNIPLQHGAVLKGQKLKDAKNELKNK